MAYTILMGVMVIGSSPSVVGSEPRNLFLFFTNLGMMFGGEFVLGICSLGVSIYYPTSITRSDLTP